MIPTRGPSSRYRLVIEALEARCLLATDVILEWNTIAIDAGAVDHASMAPANPGPTLTARALSIVHGAMFDAFNSIDRSCKTFMTRAPGAKGGSRIAAAAQAAHDTLVSLYPSQQATFDEALVQTLARVPDGRKEDKGIEVGQYVAARILEIRSSDLANFNVVYTPDGQPGSHDVDPLHPGQGFYGPGHGGIKPFSIWSVDDFPAPPLPVLNSPEYTTAYNDVKMLGGDGVTTPTTRTAEQTEIGLYWGYDGSPGLSTPPRLYNQIAKAIAIQEGNTMAENARLFALLNIAQADAGFACWEVKYDEAFWRPIVGIRAGESDGNAATMGDATWSPLGAPRSNPNPGETNFTPPFPAYPSGHATFGAAVFQTLARFYGRDDIAFTFTSDELNGITKDQDGSTRPLSPRSFDSFSEAKEENGQSRIYLGIHWSFDKTGGIALGDAVANYIFEHRIEARG